ncbi:surface antigen-domain-containing protein [Collybia nuda]|uniref:Surface antigen-domain-containing protein n=1 Tax=Collybia nuda TaxID=64659 RepID=A0A9P5XWZ1_9AGAR|nr:surface antigen-domain-containing protein [Collybia nuda]
MEDSRTGLKPPLHNSSSPRDKEPDDMEKLLKWQEDRLARKLRGEYESAVLHLSEVITSNMSSQMNIAAVRVEGAKITRSSFLGFLINPHLAASTSNGTPSTLESVLHTTRKIAHALKKTDMFHSVEAKLERARDELANEGDVDIVFKTREKGRFYLNTSTELGNNEGNAAATGRIRNVFGGAEVFEANVSFGTKTRRSFRASLTAPVTPDLATHAELTAYGLERDNSSFASSTEGLRGVKAVVRSGTPDRGAHEVIYEAVLRHIGALTPTASISMRESAGQTIKSSVSHSYIVDTRDDRITAASGHYAKIFNEYAGLGGDASFFKTEIEGQVSRPVYDGISLSFAARTGLLWGISRPTLFSDRFQLGGPTSIRAFKANSMGPRDGSDSLGGDLHWSAGVSVISNIPRKPHWPVKTHLWVNAGRLDVIDQRQTLADNIRNTLTRPSISAGVGVIYRFDPVRVEVNFGVPLVASKSDGTRRGLQVGMGLEFL